MCLGCLLSVAKLCRSTRCPVLWGTSMRKTRASIVVFPLSLCVTLARFLSFVFAKKVLSRFAITLSNLLFILGEGERRLAFCKTRYLLPPAHRLLECSFSFFASSFLMWEYYRAGPNPESENISVRLCSRYQNALPAADRTKCFGLQREENFRIPSTVGSHPSSGNKTRQERTEHKQRNEQGRTLLCLKAKEGRHVCCPTRLSCGSVGLNSDL